VLSFIYILSAVNDCRFVKAVADPDRKWRCVFATWHFSHTRIYVDRAGIFYVWLQRVAHDVARSEVRLCNEVVSGVTGSLRHDVSHRVTDVTTHVVDLSGPCCVIIVSR